MFALLQPDLCQSSAGILDQPMPDGVRLGMLRVALQNLAVMFPRLAGLAQLLGVQIRQGNPGVRMLRVRR